MPAPTSPTRLRLSPLQLLRITQSTLWQVLSHFGPDIQQRFVEALRDAHDTTITALKLPAYVSDHERRQMKEAQEEEQEATGGAFRRSQAGCYAVEERIEHRHAGAAAGGAGGGERFGGKGGGKAAGPSGGDGGTRGGAAAGQKTPHVTAMQKQGDIDQFAKSVRVTQSALERVPEAAS